MTVLRAGAVTDVGRVRSVNQDAVLADTTLFAVADGMGGHAGGEVASRTAIDALEASLPTIASSDGLVAAIQRANDLVVDQARDDPSLAGMGTTLVAATLVGRSDGDVLVVANVGDSRAYLFRAGRLEQVTADHSVAAELLRQGDINEAEAATHPQRHVITRALGIESPIEVDLFELPLEEGDRVLLCSDGLSNELDLEEMGRVLSTIEDPTEAATDLMVRANAHGGADNISVVVIDALVSDRPHTDPSETGAVLAAAATVPRPKVRPEPVVPAGAGKKEGPWARRRRLGVPRSVTFRVLLFILLVVGVLAGAWAFLRWYATSAYYVTSQGDSIVIYQGRPGGVLWFQPKLVEVTPTTVNDILPIRRGPLAHDVVEPTLADAQRYVANLASEGRSNGAVLPAAPATTAPSTTLPPFSTAPPNRYATTTTVG